MNIVDLFEALSDKQIRSLLTGKTVCLIFKDGRSEQGAISNFIKAAQFDNPDRTIIGVILNKSEEIIISKNVIKLMTFVEQDL